MFWNDNITHASPFNESDVKQMIGKSDFDYSPNEFFHAAFENEQEIIKSGQVQVDIFEKWNKQNGKLFVFQLLSILYMMKKIISLGLGKHQEILPH